MQERPTKSNSPAAQRIKLQLISEMAKGNAAAAAELRLLLSGGPRRRGALLRR